MLWEGTTGPFPCPFPVHPARRIIYFPSDSPGEHCKNILLSFSNTMLATSEEKEMKECLDEAI